MTGAPVLTHRLEGAPGATLLVLNGGMMSIGAWEPFVAPLLSSLRVLRCDLRGQLLSPGGPHLTLEGHVADVVALLDSLALPRAHVFGTSYGGEVGVLLAALHPERVASLTVVASVDRFDAAMDAEVERLRASCRDVLSGGSRRALYDLIASTSYSKAYHERNRAAIEARGAAVALLPDAWYRDLEGLLVPLLGLDLRPRLASVRCPTTVAAAGEDAVMPRAYVEGIASGIAGARFEVIDGAGHAAILEDAEAVRTLVLARVAGAAG